MGQKARIAEVKNSTRHMSVATSQQIRNETGTGSMLLDI